MWLRRKKNASAPSRERGGRACRGCRHAAGRRSQSRCRAPGSTSSRLGTRNGSPRISNAQHEMMPAHTRMNANSVPMFVGSTISSMLATAAKPPTKRRIRYHRNVRRTETAVDAPNSDGSNPSRAIENKMRGCPSATQTAPAPCARRRSRTRRCPTAQPRFGLACCRAIVSGSACSFAVRL